ncbi:MAG: hypothetical protein Q9201_001533 [Fulgogasparrea decipioides]
MAARSRLALRSSGRGNASLDDLTANPSPGDRRKRTRPLSNNHHNSGSAKRARNEPVTGFTRPTTKTYARRPAARNIAAPAVEAESLTQSAATPPTPPAQPSTHIAQQTLHDSTNINCAGGHISDHSSVETHKPPAVDKLDKRSLRSHDGGSRFKSELALYFADYDEILTDEPRNQDFLTPTTRIHIIDEPSKASMPIAPIPVEAANHQISCSYAPTTPETSTQINGRSTGGGSELNGAERLDFSSTERHTRQITEDPLTDQFYFKAHRRAERGEKQHRNREKESAQHEQSQLERILEELKGHAWLRTMGITGITDSERKIYEPKRIVFIQRVTALLNKFRAWKEEEKRRKTERERASTVDEEDEEEQEAEEDTDPSDYLAGLDGAAEKDDSARSTRTNTRAKRLRRTAVSSARAGPSPLSNEMRPRHVNSLPPPVEKPFTSFFSKPYLREAALSKHRRGRLRFAFGQQIPDLEQREFILPSGILTADVLRANARSRRAARREIKGQ